MKITYGRTAYVLNVSGEMMDRINSRLNHYAEGSDNICISYDDLVAQIEELEEDVDDNDISSILFLKEVVSSIVGAVGDVVFSR